ncbi:MAG: 5'-nucleotidase [Candidatus Cloacimonetes bacterium HGW-Cloacimonetes-1]|jgi:2',3'-cyclic-nucleotide 2'-phosphodiesterase (5'-nucleotidase family)|nr:MAG: 5'-nucleotidase [Candidatus Cloacimonetes bacterium HGW-Cloacimonetes-1]
MKRIIIALSCLLCVQAAIAIPLRVFYTNDTHGTYLPRTYSTASGKIDLGGYSELDFILTRQRQEVTRSIYLDAGDEQTGSIFSSLPHNGAIGGAVNEVFNLLQLDAACYGNHEFDQSFSNTMALTKISKYPFVSTNLRDKKTGKPTPGVPYTIIKRDSLRIGVLGLTLLELPEKVKATNVRTIDILPYKVAIDKYLKDLDKATDLIVVLSHMGSTADSMLALSLDHRIDMIIGGHDHRILEEPLVVNNILILQTGAYLLNLGQIDLDVVNDRIAHYKNALIPVSVKEPMPATEVSRFVDRIKGQINSDLNVVIGTIPEDWIPNKYLETVVSRWQVDALRKQYAEIYHPDIAMINCGGIRRSIAKGDVTLKDMTEMLPFNNKITLFSCKGSDLITFYKRNEEHKVSKPFDIVQATPMGWTTKTELETGLPGNFSVDGSKLIPDKTYRIVSHDYLAGQWDKYLGFEPFDVYDTGDLILDALVDQIKKQYAK